MCRQHQAGTVALPLIQVIITTVSNMKLHVLRFLPTSAVGYGLPLQFLVIIIIIFIITIQYIHMYIVITY